MGNTTFLLDQDSQRRWVTWWIRPWRIGSANIWCISADMPPPPHPLGFPISPHHLGPNQRTQLHYRCWLMDRIRMLVCGVMDYVCLNVTLQAMYFSQNKKDDLRIQFQSYAISLHLCLLPTSKCTHFRTGLHCLLLTSRPIHSTTSVLTRSLRESIPGERYIYMYKIKFKLLNTINTY